MPKKRPLSGAAKAGSERKAARLRDGPIEAELKGFDAKAALSTAGIADAESKLKSYQKSQEDDQTDNLFYELLQALPVEGKTNLIQDLIGRDDKELAELGNDVKRFMFSSVKARGGKTPAGSESSSISSTEKQPGSSKDTLQKAAIKRYGQSNLKKICLAREANRCRVTDLYDTNMAQELPESEREEIEDDATECAHIIPFSVGPACVRGKVDMDDAAAKAKTWAFLYRYFPGVRSVIDALSPGSINDPRNAMALVPDMHREFGRFHFGFVHKGGNEYEIETFRGLTKRQKRYMPPGRRIVFSTTTDIELPHPALLSMHLAICRVLHATGMGREIELILREIEEDQEPMPSIIDRVGEWLMSTS